MKVFKFFEISLIFMLGFLSASLLNFYMIYGGFENPISRGFGIYGLDTKEAPSDFIKSDKIKVYDDKVVIYVDGASISNYAPTGSMKPVFDENANGIRVKPESEDDIHVGDIITYERDENLIVHRVVEKGVDKEGVYFITKGDNNSIDDGKIRFNEVKYLTIGILW